MTTPKPRASTVPTSIRQPSTASQNAKHQTDRARTDHVHNPADRAVRQGASIWALSLLTCLSSDRKGETRQDSLVGVQLVGVV